jgi:predicted deacylase
VHVFSRINREFDGRTDAPAMTALDRRIGTLERHCGHHADLVLHYHTTRSVEDDVIHDLADQLLREVTEAGETALAEHLREQIAQRIVELNQQQ